MKFCSIKFVFCCLTVVQNFIQTFAHCLNINKSRWIGTFYTQICW